MVSIAKSELSILNELQEELHYPPNKSNELDSNFYEEDVPVAWYSRQTHDFESLTMSDNKIRYTAPEEMAFLHRSFLRQQLPSISVREEYKDTVQIRWTDYVAISSIINSELKIDGIEPMCLPGIWFNVYSQWFRQLGYSDLMIERLGQLPHLVTWASDLPAYRCSLQQPFFYNRSLVDALPLNLNHKIKAPTSVQHILTLRNKISQLLRMRQFVDGVWVEIHTNMNYIVAPDILPPPVLRGVFSVNTQEELDDYRCKKTGVVRYYDDIVHISAENDEELGKVMSRTLSECTRPCKAMFWMCENTSAREFNSYANFTTDSTDISLGTHPIDRSILYYVGKNQERFNLTPDEVEFDESLGVFSSHPVDQGYQAYSFSVNPLNRIDVGVVLNDLNAKMSVHLTSTTGCVDKFRLHVVMMVTRKLFFKKDESGRFVANVSE